MKVIRSIDYLRPKMQLRHRGVLFERSIFSAIISLISIVVIIAAIVYFSRPLLFRQKPTTNIYEAFSRDNYTFSINSSFYSHFITISDYYFSTGEYVDLEYFRIIGMKSSLIEYQLLKGLDIDDYWIYGPCDENDFKINDETVQLYFKDSFCIKKFFNSKDEKYYDKNDKEFQWPILSTKETGEGYSNSEYNIIIEKCEQNTLDLILGEGHQCKNDSEIYDYIEKGRRVILSYLDYDINLYDYDNPNSSSWETMEDKMYNDYLIMNRMKNNPLIVKTNKGIIFERAKKEMYYELTSDDKYTLAKSEDDKDIYINYNIVFDKQIRYYERRYRKLQDIISQIGGFLKIVSSVAHLIVRYYNELKILRDVRDIISYYYNKENKEKLEKKETINETKIELNKSNKEMRNLDLNNENLNQLKNINNEMTETNSNKNINVNKQDHNYNEKKKEDVILDDNIRNNEKEEKKEKEEKEENEENDEKSIFTEENKQFNIFSYIAHKYTLRKTFKKYSIYNNFINKVFSDEQLIKNHIILYNITHNKNPDTQIYSLSEMLKDEK